MESITTPPGPPPDAPKGPKLDSQQQQQQQQPTFTTVGSVYKPDSAAPLHPPVRRGRMQRYAGNQSEIRQQLPKPVVVLPALPKQPPVSRSPATTASSFRQYSPLRQNQDRAITPEMSQGQERLRGMGLPGDPRLKGNDAWPPFVAAVVSKNSNDPHIDGGLLPGGAAAPTTTRNTGQVNNEDAAAAAARLLDEGNNTPDSLKSLNSLNVKGLQNLASYPNKWQNGARQTLNRARPYVPTPRPALTATTNIPRPMEPSPRAPPGYGRPGRGMIRPPPGIHTGPHAAAPMHQGGMYGQGAGAGSRLSGPPTPLPPTPPTPRPPPPHHAFSNQGAAIGHGGGNYVAPGNSAFSAMSKGPGAPPPLTAGPPGQRQYKASTFQTTRQALEESAQRASQVPPTTGGSAAGYGFQNPIGYGRRTPDRTPDRTGGPATTPRPGWNGAESLGGGGGGATYPHIDHQQQSSSAASYMMGGFRPANEKSGITDTATPEQVRQYYPHPIGHIPNYNYDPNAARASHQKIPDFRQLHLTKDAQLATHRTNDFYSGTSLLSKTSDTIIDDAERAGSSQAPDGKRSGEPGDDARPGPTNYPALSIAEANQMPTSEQAAPLVNMLFERMHSHVKEGGEKGSPSGFVEASPRLIDNTPEGRQSFWGKKEE